MDLTPTCSIVPMTKKTSYYQMTFSKAGLKKLSMLDLELYYQGVAKFEVSAQNGTDYDLDSIYLLSFLSIDKIGSKDGFDTVFSLGMDDDDKRSLLQNRDFYNELRVLFTKELKNAAI